MAKLIDKFFNRVIEGKLEVGASDIIAPEAVGGAIAGGNVENAKPLYFHPITIYQATNKYSFTMMIINNDETPFTKTSLIAYLRSPTTKGRYLVNGAYYFTHQENNYYLSPSYCIYNTSADKVLLVGFANDGTLVGAGGISIDFENLISASSTFEDEVNKLN